MTTATEPLVITEPGIYDGIPDDLYHRDPVVGGSLSSTGARRLLPPYCPAIYRWERDNPPRSKTAYDLGKGAHLRVLGAGPEVERVDAKDWKTKAARDARDAAYTAGKVPLLAHQIDEIDAMAAALRRNPLAAALLDPATGSAEQTAVWTDPDTGVTCRARFDFLRDRAPGRPLIVDYKTTTDANPEHIRRAVASYGYHQQHPFYLDGAIELGLDTADFVFVFQAKTPPYLVTVISLDDTAVDVGRQLNRRAMEVYAECTATGCWPGYADDIVSISLPLYATRESEITYV